MRELLAAGAPLDLVSNVGPSALSVASCLGHEHIAKALLGGELEGKGAESA